MKYFHCAAGLLGLWLFKMPHGLAQSITPAPDGTGTIVTPEGNQIQIQGGTAAGRNLFHSFEHFNLSPEQTANFIANPHIQNILGRVTGGDASIVNGLIQVRGAEANLILMNPAGILFGNHAQLNVPASFTATTATSVGLGEGAWFNALGTNDYAKLINPPDQFAFATPHPGAIFNAGDLAVPTGRALSLLGGTVVNTGSLRATNGRVSIAAVSGQQFIRVTPQGNLLSLELPIAPPSHPEPKSLPELLTGGHLGNATQVTIEHGKIKLTSTHTTVATDPGTAIVNGSISAPTIQIAGERIALLNAHLNASGNQGGTIQIGNTQAQQFPTQFIFGDAHTRIQADGEPGKGGQVNLSATRSMRFHGTISALGQGFVQTTGNRFLDITGATVKTNQGTWLLSSSDVRIAETERFKGGIFDLSCLPISAIAPATIANALDHGNHVKITTLNGTGQGDITLVDSIHQAGGGTAALTLTGRQLIREGNAKITLTSTGGLTFNLNQINPETQPSADSIQAAIDAIGNVNGDRKIRLGAGLYRWANLKLKTSVSIIGTDPANTILTGDNTSRVLQVDPGVSAKIENLSITQGVAPAGESGGGILNQGNLSIRNSRITNNNALQNGGGIESVGKTARLRITESNVSENTAKNGGGISNQQGSQAMIRSTVIEKNVASQKGGGIYNNSTIEVQTSQILSNIANRGGGLYLKKGDAIIGTSTIARNQSRENGGGLFNGSNTTITNSTLSNNTAIAGGGVFNRATLRLLNSTVSSNTATTGSGIYVDRAEVTLQSVTIANNRADQGGLVNQSGQVSLQNTIVAGNTAKTAPDVSGEFTDLDNNLIGVSDGSTGFTVSKLIGTATQPIDPKLGDLVNNGGQTQTHALQSGSPAINAGNNAAAVGDKDQRGAPRIQQGTIDIGAVESTLVQPLSPTPSPAPTPSPSPIPLPSPSPVPSPSPSPSPSPPKIDPKDTTNPRTLPNANPPNNSVQPIDRIFEPDRSLSNDFAQFFGIQNVPNVTVEDIQNLLTQQQTQNVRSAIVYALFVPNSVPPAPKAGETLSGQEPTIPLLRSRTKRSTDRLDLILVTATGQPIRYSTNTTRSRLLQQAKLYRLAVADVEDEQSFQALSKQLFQWLVKPLEGALQQQTINSLIYSLDEGLRTLPIAAMSDDHGFVTDRYMMSVIPSVALLGQSITNLTNRTMLAMGADRFQALEPLPAVPTELNLVSQKFWKGTPLLNENFTLERLLQEKQRLNPGIVHLATHAKFNAGAPSQSYIQFWDRQVKLSEMTGIEWANPPLQLLVLSACDTAIGSTEAELGFSGLAAASGVHSVLGSLWEVSDIGTLALMSEFYIQLATAPTRSEALRRAQVALRNGTVRVENGNLITSRAIVPLPPNILSRSRAKSQRETIEFRHPFYWSAFTLVGNPW
jgi:filamentous hemagglutinin family protein